MKKILILLATTLVCLNGHAQNNPVSFSSDARIKYVHYQENNVVPIEGRAFVTTHIKFGDKEEVLDIEGGDTAAWMVTYHAALANTLFVKPTLSNSNTNLTVITNKHIYYFHLTNHTKNEKSGRTYALHFRYPESEPKPVKASTTPTKESASMPRVLNTAYRFSGSPQLLPLHVFDDGQFTYFELSTQGTVPAIFAVEDKSGKESTVNTRHQGKYIVVQRLAPQFTLREGKLATSVFNTLEISRIAANRRPQ